MANGFLMLAIAYLWQRAPYVPPNLPFGAALPNRELLAQARQETTLDVGDTYTLNYQQWVALLAQEARVAAQNKPDNLYILLGDSISLWFPKELLPVGKTWLNQGISGETTLGLLRRLTSLDETEPKAIFVMIGINDLLKGISDDTILANQRLIVRYLKSAHPNTTIVMQSILPHGGEGATWEGRDRLLALPNQRIQGINDELRKIAESENVMYLNLYPIFANQQGQLKMDLSTDGLHLNQRGYALWNTALQVFIQAKLSP
ncbi:lysophospholipase [Oscillatoria sp. FACHB-1406]|nr:lysophospholipase [Oscillatoria sp. FACHB-1406]